MNCRTFHRDLGDWLRGRLPDDCAALMTEHRASCPSCAAAESAERTLAGMWTAIPSPRPVHELWPAVAARLESPAPSRPIFAPRRWALASTLAAGALCAIMWVRMGATGPPAQPQANEIRVVSMVADLRTIPQAEQDLSLVAERRDLFLGRKDQP